MQAYEAEAKEKYNDVIEAGYNDVYTFAQAHVLTNTVLMLNLSKALLYDDQEIPYSLKPYAFRHFDHSIKVCKLMIDLHLSLTDLELDQALAAEIGHVLCEIVIFPSMGQELCTEYHLDKFIYKIIKILYNQKLNPQMSDEEYYSRIKKHKLAMLIKMAETAILMEQLFKFSLSEVYDKLRHIRTYFFPMCIFAKEYYSELGLVISVLMEKVRLLLEVNDILSNRYNEREIALVHEMLVLEEENARIRVSIRELQENHLN